jgi:hypothetical protein
LGTVIYKIDEMDLPTLKKISENNNNFYIAIKGDKSGVRTLLYSGKFVFFEDVKFLSSTTTESKSNSDTSSNFEQSDFTDKQLSKKPTKITQAFKKTTSKTQNKNLFVFLTSDVNVTEFEIYLSSIGADIHFKQAGGNSTTLTYMYFILNVTPAVVINIKERSDVQNAIEIGFDVGKNRTSKLNITEINSMVTSFNCSSISSKKIT